MSNIPSPPPRDVREGVFARLMGELSPKGPNTDYLLESEQAVELEKSKEPVPLHRQPSVPYDHSYEQRAYNNIGRVKQKFDEEQLRKSAEEEAAMPKPEVNPDGSPVWKSAYYQPTLFGEKAERLQAETAIKREQAHPWLETDDEHEEEEPFAKSLRPLPDVPLTEYTKAQVWYEREDMYLNDDEMVDPNSFYDDKYPPHVLEQMKSVRYREMAPQYEVVKEFTPRIQRRIKGVGPKNLGELSTDYLQAEIPRDVVEWNSNEEAYEEQREDYDAWQRDSTYPFDVEPTYRDEARDMHTYSRAMRGVLDEQNYLDAFQENDQFYDVDRTDKRLAYLQAEEFAPKRPDAFWMPPEFIVAREPSNWGHVTDQRITPFLKHMEYEIGRRLTVREVNAIIDRWNLEKTEYVLEWRRMDEDSDKWFADFVALRPWEQQLSDALHRQIAQEVEQIDKELYDNRLRVHLARWIAHRWRVFANRWQRRWERFDSALPHSSEEALSMGKQWVSTVNSALTLEAIARWKAGGMQKLTASLIEHSQVLQDKFKFYTSAMAQSAKTAPTALELARVLDLRDKVALITGGKDGIGMETAKALAVAGARVIITSRDPLECRERVMRLKASTGLDNVNCLHLDLSDFTSIVRFVERFRATGFPLHILINNAATIRPHRFFNSMLGSHFGYAGGTFGVNMVGPSILTEMLIPSMYSSGGGRIINVTCGAHRFAAFEPNNIRFAIGTSSSYEGYAMSKLGNIIHANHIAASLNPHITGITANSVNPGALIDTPLLHNTAFHWLLAKFGKWAKLTRTAEQAAAEIVNLAGNPALNTTSGYYFENFKAAKPSSLATDPVVRERWVAEVKQIGESSIYESRHTVLQPFLDHYRQMRRAVRNYPGEQKKGEVIEDPRPQLDELLAKEEHREREASKPRASPEQIVKAKLRSGLQTPYNAWLEARRTGTNALDYMRQHNFEASPVAAELLAGDMPSPVATLLPPNYADDRKFFKERIPTPYQLPVERMLDDVMSHYELPFAATGAAIVYNDDPRTPADIRQQAPGSKRNDSVPLKVALKEWVASVFLHDMDEEERRYKDLSAASKKFEDSPPVAWYMPTTGFIRDLFLGTEQDRNRINRPKIERQKQIEALESKDDLGIGIMTLPDLDFTMEEVVHPERLAAVKDQAWTVSKRYTETTRSPLTRRKILLDMDEKVQRQFTGQPVRLPIETKVEEKYREVQVMRRLEQLPAGVPLTPDEEIAWVNREYDSWFDRKPGVTPPRDDIWWNRRALQTKTYSPYAKY